MPTPPSPPPSGAPSAHLWGVAFAGLAVAFGWYLLSRVDDLSKTLRAQDSQIRRLESQLDSVERTVVPGVPVEKPAEPVASVPAPTPPEVPIPPKPPEVAVAPKPPEAPVPSKVSPLPEPVASLPPVLPPPLPPPSEEKSPAPRLPEPPVAVPAPEPSANMHRVFTGDEEFMRAVRMKGPEALQPPVPAKGKVPGVRPPVPPAEPAPPAGSAPKPGEIGLVLEVRTSPDGSRLASIGLHDTTRTDLRKGMVLSLYHKGEPAGRFAIEALPSEMAIPGVIRTREQAEPGARSLPVQQDDVAVLPPGSVEFLPREEAPPPPKAIPAPPPKAVPVSTPKAVPQNPPAPPQPPEFRPGGIVVDFVSLPERTCILKAGQKDGLRMGDTFDIVREGQIVAQGKVLTTFESESTIIWERIDPAVAPRKGDFAFKVILPPSLPQP